MADLFSLKDKVILITGASRGLGFAMGEAMAEYGARVVLSGRSQEKIDAKAKQLTDRGLLASTLCIDVGNSDDCVSGIKQVIDDQGRLDVLVHNAGNAEYAPVTEYPTDMWQRLMDVHLTAGFVLSREAGRHMAERGSGTIINIGSIAGGKIAFPTIPAYAAAKAGLEGLTKLLAVELGPKGVTANCIAPGYFHTELGGTLTEGEPPPEAVKPFYRLVEEHTPLGRWAQPSEIAGLGVFLASDSASYMNGAIIYIDGGMSVMQ